jgi:surface protein
MSFKLGNTNISELYVGSNKIAQAYFGSNLVYQAAAPVDPLNPLNLPPNTVRVRTSDGNPPTKVSRTSYETATLVPGTTDIYDVYKSGTSFSYLLYSSSNIIEVLGANTSIITDMSYIFPYCTSLTTVQIFDTSNVTNMEWMFKDCTSLTTIPLFNTSKVTDSVNRMCYNCINVESGALALYQQLSTKKPWPPPHNMTFSNCGSNTTAGAAELAQIPSDWK